MPQVSFCFSGWVRRANISKVINVKGKEIDVSKMSNEELAEKLNDGEFFIILEDYLYNNGDSEIEIFDYEGK